MSTVLIFVELLLVRLAAQSLTHIQAYCNENVTMPCEGIQGNKDFRTVSWYKLINQTRNGIIRKSDKEVRRYNFSGTAGFGFGEEHGLFLSSVRPEDSGTYECAIGAKVGGQNSDSTVTLMVSVCVTPAYVPNITHTSPACITSLYVEDLSVTWSIIGYLVVGLVKIALSLITIWVVRAIRNRSSKRKLQRWQSS